MRIIGPETETPKLGFEGRMTNQGLRIERVLYNSLAYDAGLEQGDVISRVNGWIDSMQDYQRAMIEARDHHNGRVQLRIDNVRWHSGESGQRWVNRTVYLPRLDRPMTSTAAAPSAARTNHSTERNQNRSRPSESTARPCRVSWPNACCSPLPRIETERFEFPAATNCEGVVVGMATHFRDAHCHGSSCRDRISDERPANFPTQPPG
ncbi:MAG: PDZ domain-containing protein [Pirellulaceae bacterium]